MTRKTTPNDKAKGGPSSGSTVRTRADRKRGDIHGRTGELKLTPELQAAIVASLDAGAWFATACEAHGVHRETGKAWRWKGEGRKRDPETGKWVRVAEVGPEPYRSFALAVRRAIGRADAADEQILATHSKTDWRAAAYRLERRNPLTFGGKVIPGVNGGATVTGPSSDGTVAPAVTYVFVGAGRRKGADDK